MIECKKYNRSKNSKQVRVVTKRKRANDHNWMGSIKKLPTKRKSEALAGIEKAVDHEKKEKSSDWGTDKKVKYEQWKKGLR